MDIAIKRTSNKNTAQQTVNNIKWGDHYHIIPLPFQDNKAQIDHEAVWYKN